MNENKAKRFSVTENMLSQSIHRRIKKFHVGRIMMELSFQRLFSMNYKLPGISLKRR